MLTGDQVASLVDGDLFPLWLTERASLDNIDRWLRWDHDDPHKPTKQPTAEYTELMARSQAPWGDLVVSSIAQTLYVEGYRRPDEPNDATGWDIWQANGMDGRQVAQNRSTLGYGTSYGTVLPGRTLSGDPMPVMRGFSPREMIAVYEDPAVDRWPVYAMRVRRRKGRYRVEVFDREARYTLDMDTTGGRPQLLSVELHMLGTCPVVRFTNRVDLEGRATGEIEPIVPVLGKIDQTSFDRLVVQRFASWVVRTIAGLDVQATAEANNVSQDRVQMILRANDLLTARDPDTKFGSLPATPLDGFIKAHEADLTTLAAVSQTPAFELMGQMANLSAEALAAAKSSQTAKSDERKHTLGETYEQWIRLACHAAGDSAGAGDFKAQVRWGDTTIRSLAQAVDAFGKAFTMLGYPAELLWEKIPGFTKTDVDEAKDLVRSGGELIKQPAPDTTPTVDMTVV